MRTMGDNNTIIKGTIYQVGNPDKKNYNKTKTLKNYTKQNIRRHKKLENTEGRWADDP